MKALSKNPQENLYGLNKIEKKIICTVTNDLTYDQRMIRICNSLVKAGYQVELLGRVRPGSKPLTEEAFQQTRLYCFFEKGKLFYLEFNLRLLLYLWPSKVDLICSIDLDTILPGTLVSFFRQKKQIYDAHEYYTESPEIIRRPRIKWIWEQVAKITIPNIRYAYTVCESLSQLLGKRYGIPFEVIRNVPYSEDLDDSKPHLSNTDEDCAILLYQGVLNEGRGLEEIIYAMEDLRGVELWLAGEGDLSKPLRALVKEIGVAEKVKFLGHIKPHELKRITRKATIGLNLLKNTSLNYYYSLANKAFDYIQAGIPSIHMNFPEYQRINEQFGVFLLIDQLEKHAIVTSVNRLLQDKPYYNNLKKNCIEARKVLNWEEEEKKLWAFYRAIL